MIEGSNNNLGNVSAGDVHTELRKPNVFKRIVLYFKKSNNGDKDEKKCDEQNAIHILLFSLIVFEGFMLLCVLYLFISKYYDMFANYTHIPNDMVVDSIFNNQNMEYSNDGGATNDSSELIEVWNQLISTRSSNDVTNVSVNLTNQGDEDDTDKLLLNGNSSLYECSLLSKYSVDYIHNYPPVYNTSELESIQRYLYVDDTDCMNESISNWMGTLCETVNLSFNDRYVYDVRRTPIRTVLWALESIGDDYPTELPDYVGRYFNNIFMKFYVMDTDIFNTVSEAGFSYCQYKVSNVTECWAVNDGVSVRLVDIFNNVFQNTHQKVNNLFEVTLTHYSNYSDETYETYIYIAETELGSAKWFYVVDFVPANLYHLSDSDYDSVLNFREFGN